jgi:integrase
MRHTAITNDAAAGNSPLSIMKHAGHSDFKTTQRYIDLAGVTFREEAERAERRLLGEFVRSDESPEATRQEA